MTPLLDPSYREVPLTKGQVARVSPHRYEQIASHNWYAYWNKRGRCFYAARNSPRINGKRHCILMAREILGLKYGDPREADHVNNKETLNNTDENLRVVDRSKQNQNTSRHRDNVTGFKGVSRQIKSGRFMARIKVDGVTHCLGERDTPAEAHELYKAAARKYFGEHARFE
jgi:hypothetical protein